MASSDRTINVRKHSWFNFGTTPVYGWKERKESHDNRQSRHLVSGLRFEPEAY